MEISSEFTNFQAVPDSVSWTITILRHRESGIMLQPSSDSRSVKNQNHPSNIKLSNLKIVECTDHRQGMYYKRFPPLYIRVNPQPWKRNRDVKKTFTIGMTLKFDRKNRGLDHVRPSSGPISGSENDLEKSTAHLVIIEKP